MKRSMLNQILKEAEVLFTQHGWNLPKFAHFTPEQWANCGHEYDEIRTHMLGWDITDFGSGEFDKVGLFLFTIRNGLMSDPNCKKTYAEKLMLVKENQVTPMHFHWNKMEDIINRGGGNLMIQLYNATDEETLADTTINVSIDGQAHVFPAGVVVTIHPGESITLPQLLYHSFWGEADKGPVIVGEVSKVNDDTSDNRFLEARGRFPTIEEDCAPYRLLCSEYPAAK